jgi:phosphatidylglycerophosphate synthase
VIPGRDLLQERPAFQRTTRSVLSDVLLSFVLTIAFAWIVQRPFGLSSLFLLKVTLIFGAGALLITTLAQRYLPSRTLGPANCVTLARAALVSLLLAATGEPTNSTIVWSVVAVASLAVALDGVDGWLARSRSDASNFGARFDMETDAMLILAAAVLDWQYGKAGSWILVSGLMRYLFVASSYLWPWMNRPLPPSRRRQAGCVGQELALILCLLPFFPSPVSDVIAAAGLALLCVSFGIDVVSLVAGHIDQLAVGDRRK